MFTQLDLAREVHGQLLEVRAILANSVAGIKGRCSDDEYRVYRKMVGDALGTIVVEGLTPIEERHPSLIQQDIDAST